MPICQVHDKVVIEDCELLKKAKFPTTCTLNSHFQTPPSSLAHSNTFLCMGTIFRSFLCAIPWNTVSFVCKWLMFSGFLRDLFQVCCFSSSVSKSTRSSIGKWFRIHKAICSMSSGNLIILLDNNHFHWHAIFGGVSVLIMRCVKIFKKGICFVFDLS